jgi:hypothetical protein
MESGPAAGLDLRYARVGRAAFALARRICADDAAASEVVEQAFATSPAEPEGAVGDGLLLRRVRDLACGRRRRAASGPVAVSAPPAALAELSSGHWRVLDLVALRGAGIGEAAVRLGMPEDSVLTLLHEGLGLTRELLSGAGQAGDDADSPRLALLR